MQSKKERNLGHALAGKLIVFDGPDGCGKSTMMAEVANALTAGYDDIDIVMVREPGGTSYGEFIRDILLHKQPDDPTEKLEKSAEMLLFMAARLQLMDRVVIPALSEGKTVFADRFVSSTLAYQGAGLGIDFQQIIDIHKLAIPDPFWPACTIVLDVCEKIAFDRRCQKKQDPDKIEEREDEFRRNVRMGYIKQAALYPEHVQLVDANGDIDEVRNACISALEKHLLVLGQRPTSW